MGKRLGTLLLALAVVVAASPLVWAAPTTLRFAIVSGPDHLHNVVLREWFKELEEKSGGQLRVRFLESAQLGGERDYIEMLMQGALDMAQVSTGPLSAFIPEFSVVGLPYVFRDAEHFRRVLEGPVGAKLLSLLEPKGIKGLTFFDNGYRHVFNNRRPIRTPEDMKGLKIRVLESPLMVATINAMGAAAIPMAYGELYTAIQSGVLDGAENAPGNVLNDKFYEITKYYSLTGHFRPPGVVMISLRTWNRLSREMQQLIQQTAEEMGRREARLTVEVERNAIEELKRLGMQVNEVDPEPFRQSVKPVYERFSREVGSLGNELLEMILNTQ